MGTNWAVSRTFALLRRLVVNEVPAGATVTVTCKGRGCPFKSRTFAASRTGTATATKTFARKRLRPGVVLEVRITKPGAIGRVLTYKLVRGKVPKALIQCLAVGATKPAKSC